MPYELTDEEIAKQIAAGRGFEDMVNYVNKQKEQESIANPPTLESGEITVTGKARPFKGGGRIEELDPMVKDIVSKSDYGKQVAATQPEEKEDKSGTSQDMNDWLLASAIMGGSTLLGELFGGKRGGAIGSQSGEKGVNAIISARDYQENLRQKKLSDAEKANAAQKLKMIEGQIKQAEQANDLEGKKQLEEMKGKLERDLQGPMSKSESAENVAKIRAASSGKNAGITPYQSEMLGLRRQEVNERATTKYGEMLQKQNIDKTIPAIQTVDKIASKYPKGDIPGIGAYDANMPSWTVSGESNEMRSALKSVIVPQIKEYFGSAQSGQELAKANKMYGEAWYDDESAFRAVWPRLKQAYMTDLKNMQATFRPEAVEAFESRGGSKLSEAVGSLSQPKGLYKIGETRNVEDPVTKKIKTYVRNANGQWMPQ